MILGLLLLALTGAHGAPAAEPPDSPPPTTPAESPGTPRVDVCQARPADRSAPFVDELERAKRLYRRGCHEFALELFRALDVRRQLADVDEELAIDQRAYLGEVLLVLGRREAARGVFELLLIDHPDTQLGLLEHDPDAVALFESVKASLSSRVPDPPPELILPRRPAWSYLPFGVAHAMNGDRGRARTYGLSLGVLATTSLVSAAFVPTGPIDAAPDVLRRASRARAVNWSSTGAFLVVYAISQADASARWKARKRAELVVSPRGVGVSGRF